MAGPSIKRRKTIASVLPEELAALEQCLLATLSDAEDLFGWNLSPEKGTITKRVANEGIGFLALRLPEFFDWILLSCRAEKLQLPLPRFKFGKDKTRPAFLRKFVDKLFDVDGNFVHPESNAEREFQGEVFKFINVICTSFGKKYELPLSEERADEQVRDFFAFDKTQCLDVADHFDQLSSEAQMVLRRARSLLERLTSTRRVPGVVDGLHTLKNQPFLRTELEFGFGPGAVYEGYNACEKYQRFKTPPLTAVKDLGLLQVFAPAPGVSDADNIMLVGDFSPKERHVLMHSMRGGVGRCAVVPKKYGTGRIITLMYNELMYVQQGYKRVLYEEIEKHPMTIGQVNFTDQGHNRRAALTASRDGKHGTLDLTRASDSVSRGHVSIGFSGEVCNMLLLLRPHRLEALLNDGSELSSDNVRMYAPMGSALCFPVEALIFWACAKACLELAGCWDNVLVYGDDIIVPTDYCDNVITTFSELGFVVNKDKSFWTGPFRESCGMFALSGVDVSAPFRIKKRIPSAKIEGVEPDDRNTNMVAWVQYANLAEQGGFPSLAAQIRKLICTSYPKAHAFPHTKDITEVSEGYLAFLDYSCGKTVRDPRRTITQGVDEALKHTLFVCQPSSVFEQDMIGPFLPDSEGERKALQLSSLGTYRTTVWPGSSQQTQWKSLYTSEVRRYKPEQFSEPLAYMRWVLEKAEDSRSFDRDEFRVVRRRVQLS